MNRTGTDIDEKETLIGDLPLNEKAAIMNTRGTICVKTTDSIMSHTWMKTILNVLLIVALAVFAARAQAQDEVPPPMPASQTFTDAQLQQLLGPVALYPDPLIAIILPAATLPSQIVMADRLSAPAAIRTRSISRAGTPMFRRWRVIRMF